MHNLINIQILCEESYKTLPKKHKIICKQMETHTMKRNNQHHKDVIHKLIYKCGLISIKTTSMRCCCFSVSREVDCKVHCDRQA